MSPAPNDFKLLSDIYLSKLQKQFEKKGIIRENRRMPKKINYTLESDELKIVEEAIKNHESLRVRERARLIRLLHKGYKPKEVADMLSISQGQIYWWNKRWRSQGLEGLQDKERSGRPKLADGAYRQRLEELMATEPKELGYAFKVWTVKRLQAHLEKETEVSMCERTFFQHFSRRRLRLPSAKA